jgi:hypothetical protein
MKRLILAGLFLVGFTLSSKAQHKAKTKSNAIEATQKDPVLEKKKLKDAKEKAANDENRRKKEALKAEEEKKRAEAKEDALNPQQAVVREQKTKEITANAEKKEIEAKEATRVRQKQSGRKIRYQEPEKD